uniref:Uncharacterized protein n=1 Tax=Minutocellus polymorphus TaxID=265543 RepID=A0A7S0AYW7_9STRA|mmetsp:Transcript_6821/g.11383  ORF Transcript_6821/g.11383 Transcript_6821/m.11383 type:complete len:290 (+) Transcript_6821:33-902(+)
MSSSDDDQPDAKRQKTYDADGPVEDDKTARDKLREAGFDPDDVHTAAWSDTAFTFYPSDRYITPMTYFAIYDDLPMCRYLHFVRGAATTATTAEKGERWFPMHAAVDWENHELAKWLYLHGAKEDVWRRISGVYGNTFIRSGPKIQEWFILRGVMQTSDGQAHEARIKRVMLTRRQENNFDKNPCHLELIESYIPWCNDTLEELDRPFVKFHTFLMGTTTPGKASRQFGDRPTPHNRCLGSFRGILEHIGGYVLGNTKAINKEREHLRQFSQVVSNMTLGKSGKSIKST